MDTLTVWDMSSGHTKKINEFAKNTEEAGNPVDSENQPAENKKQQKAREYMQIQHLKLATIDFRLKKWSDPIAYGKVSSIKTLHRILHGTPAKCKVAGFLTSRHKMFKADTMRQQLKSRAELLNKMKVEPKTD